MTPEQSNLAKLLANMRMAASGMPASVQAGAPAQEQQQQQQQDSASSPLASSTPPARVASGPLQPPSFLQAQSTGGGQSAVRPKFFTGQQVRYP